MYGGHSPYGRMGPSQASPYGAPHPHTSPMSQFSPNFAMTSPIGPGGVMQPGMGPYGMIVSRNECVFFFDRNRFV